MNPVLHLVLDTALVNMKSQVRKLASARQVAHRRFSLLYRSFLLVCLAYAFPGVHACQAGQSSACATPERSPALANAILDQARPALIDIDTSLTRIQGKVSHASGFVAGKRNWVVTNAHTVDPSIVRPEEYQVKIVGATGQRLSSRVIAMDIANDLALLETGLPLKAEPLTLAEQIPPPSETVYAMGSTSADRYSATPGQIQGIDPGTNGQALRFHGVIRPGMSGGPVLNAQGQVVGVNRSALSSRPEQGFLVALGPLRQLLDRASAAPYTNHTAMQEDLGRQQRAMAAKLVSDMVNPFSKMQSLGPFRVHTIYPDCSGTRLAEPEERFKVYRISCSIDWRANEKYAFGIPALLMRHYWVSNTNFHAVETSLAVNHLLEILRSANAESTEVAKAWECRRSRVKNRHGLLLDLHACRRSLDTQPGIYDHRLRAAAQVRGADALVSMLDIQGSDTQNAMKMAETWLDGLNHKTTQSSEKERP